MLYLETSALLRAAVQRQPEVLERMAQRSAWVTSALALVECERVLVAMKHRKTITGRRHIDAMAYLRDVAWRSEQSELDHGVFERTIQPFLREPARTLDGMHLASILRWAEKGPSRC